MTTKSRMSASVDADLVEAGREAVRRGDATSFSAWVNDALQRHVAHERRQHALERFIAAYEAEHGVISDDEATSAVRRARARAVVVRGSKDSAGGRRARRRA